jgi:hypothetical protein
MSTLQRTAALVLCLAALMPMASATPLLTLSDAAQAAAGCGMLATSCCCEPTAPVANGGCACTPSPVRAPAPVPTAPSDDAPRASSLHWLGVASVPDAAPPAPSAHDRTALLPRPDGAPPGRLLYCVFRL